MADFPVLKTGAIAQYPAERILGQPARVLRFVDNAEQSFRLQATPLKRWTLNLSLLDEDEVARLELFFSEQAGQLGDFAFKDPWDGSEYPSCRFAADGIAIQVLGEGRASTRLVIQQNRS